MTLKSYLWGMRIAAVLSLVIWLLALNQIDPFVVGSFGKALFFLATFILLSGFFVNFFTWLRIRSVENEMMHIQLAISFRQGVLISFLSTILLFMQSLRILTWWDSMLTVAGILLIELYFLTRR